jgi:hypothetical protein
MYLLHSDFISVEDLARLQASDSDKIWNVSISNLRHSLGTEHSSSCYISAWLYVSHLSGGRSYSIDRGPVSWQNRLNEGINQFIV